MEDKTNMLDLEISFLNVFLLTHGITEKIEKKFNDIKLSNNEFINLHPSYADLNQLMYHASVLQARKLWEAKLYYDLTKNEWFKITEFRHGVAHSKEKEDQSLKVIGDLNHDLIPILNKINRAIYEKYNLDGNLQYEEYVNNYLKDIENL